jgi:hypothetical protein
MQRELAWHHILGLNFANAYLQHYFHLKGLAYPQPRTPVMMWLLPMMTQMLMQVLHLSAL